MMLSIWRLKTSANEETKGPMKTEPNIKDINKVDA